MGVTGIARGVGDGVADLLAEILNSDDAVALMMIVEVGSSRDVRSKVEQGLTSSPLFFEMDIISSLFLHATFSHFHSSVEQRQSIDRVSRRTDPREYKMADRSPLSGPMPSSFDSDPSVPRPLLSASLLD